MFSFTKDTEYALLCLTTMGEKPGEPISARALADTHQISPSLVAKILQKLQRSAILASISGIRGGYVLTRPASSITIEDVVNALHGDPHLVNCSSKDGCERSTICRIGPAMRELQKDMWSVMENTTVADLMKKHRVAAQQE